MIKTLFPACALLLLVGTLPSAFAAPPQSATTKPESPRWLSRAVAAYRTHTIPLVTAAVSPTWLEAQYDAQPPQSMNAAAVAYYGAIGLHP